ncbi:MAG: hypothetical protein AB7E55_26270, partial [Pigmentiphaga sp.]
SMAFQPTMAAGLPELPLSAPIAAPAAVGMAAASQGASSSAPRPGPTITQRFEFHITQGAGEDAEALARRVADLVRREGQSARRAALGDW